MNKRKTILSLCFIVVMLIVTAMSCGDKKSSPKAPKSNPQHKSVKLIPKPIMTALDPLTMDPSKVISVDELTKSFMSVKGKQVTIVAYPNFFFDKGKLGAKADFTAKPGDKKKLVECYTMAKKDETELLRNTPLVIKGTIDKLPREAFKRFGLETIRLTNCELVSKGEVKNTVPASFSNIDKGIMKIEDFHQSYYAWINKTISVTGYYYSTTKSTTRSGKSIRIDLKSPNKNSKVKVGFSMKSNFKNKKITNRDGVIIKGKVAGEVFNNVRLKDCELTNR